MINKPNVITSILQYNNNYLWIGTNQGIRVYEYKSNQFIKHYFNSNDHSPLTHNWIKFIEKDSKNNIWIGTYQGLNLYDRKNDTFSHFIKDIYSETTISDNQLLSVYLDYAGCLWLGTFGGGVNKLLPLSLEIDYFRIFDPKSTKPAINSINEFYVRVLHCPTKTI